MIQSQDRKYDGKTDQRMGIARLPALNTEVIVS